MKQFKFFLLTMCLHLATHAKVFILCTAALLPSNSATRKQEYIQCLKTLRSYGLSPYVIESCRSSGPTFLDNYSQNVFYAGTNNAKLANKGVNEARSLIAAFNHYNFNDDDIIIKLTGRYILEPDTFLSIVKKNQDVDAIVKRSKKNGQVFVVCFAMKYFHMKRMFNSLNLNHMEQHMVNLERAVANYIDQNNLNTLNVERIGLSGRVGGTTQAYTA